MWHQIQEHKFATRRDVSADKQAHQMTRQKSIKHIRKQKWTYTA